MPAPSLALAKGKAVGGFFGNLIRIDSGSIPPPSQVHDACDLKGDEFTRQRDLICELCQQVVAVSVPCARRDELKSHGRLLSSSSIPLGAAGIDFPIHEVFLKYSGSADSASIKDQYLVTTWQYVLTGIGRAHAGRPVTLTLDSPSNIMLNTSGHMRSSFTNVDLRTAFGFEDDLYVCESVNCKGIVILCDRGRDLYKPCKDGGRTCRHAQVYYFVTALEPRSPNPPLSVEQDSSKKNRFADPLVAYVDALPQRIGCVS